MSLSSKAILVTGSASGLGLTIAKSLLARGALVTICDVNPSRVLAEWWLVDGVLEPLAGESRAAAFEIRRGTCELAPLSA